LCVKWPSRDDVVVSRLTQRRKVARLRSHFHIFDDFATLRHCVFALSGLRETTSWFRGDHNRGGFCFGPVVVSLWCARLTTRDTACNSSPACRMRSSDRLLEASVAVLSGIGFEVRGIRQTVAPLESILSHYGDDAAAPRS